MFKVFGLIMRTAFYNFRQWRGNTRIWATFILAFILCFFLTDQTVSFASEYNISIQLVEAFIWTFGDSNSILLTSLLLLLLYSDMPFISPATPFFLARGSRKTWVFGQMVYIFMSTFLYLCFILFSTCILCMPVAYTANIWSRGAAMLAYLDTGTGNGIPVQARLLEMSRPYEAMAGIFALLLIYTLVMVFIMLFFNLWKGPVAGVVSVIIFSVYGLLLNPENIQQLLDLPDVLYYKARVWVGWLSPLNHATFSMHDFGYDQLPTLAQTGGLFAVLLGVLIFFTLRAMRRYGFQFKGTES